VLVPILSERARSNAEGAILNLWQTLAGRMFREIKIACVGLNRV